MRKPPSGAATNHENNGNYANNEAQSLIVKKENYLYKCLQNSGMILKKRSVGRKYAIFQQIDNVLIINPLLRNPYSSLTFSPPICYAFRL